ncbi:NF-kappa-B inhibitor cactus-like [Phymastichus coffea]|uniref:NF-kappa-B inhibitor cactus-like n=1 Tax=Phymastichus coffea TaxID=108790 RepID=UPI00273B5FAD|nr:NF-kappa-B inhibitor cactus-like [Phymastichus coffea]XP_058789979.1 NF-kappa-B inhibitor cactus-like [Phymastichus coffea]XP_058789980.1 NF-kappa-B inhibitor cactus-like [Phymastichus coffea]
MSQKIVYQPKMKTFDSADLDSQLSESFIHQLKLEGVEGNDLSRCTQPAFTKNMFLVDDFLPDDFYHCDIHGDTQLHISIIVQAFDVTEYLIDTAPNPSYLDIVNKEQFTALHYAVLAENYSIVRKLVLAGANTEARTYDGDTALHLAVKEQRTESVRALTDPFSLVEKSLAPHPALINSRNYYGMTALHIAAYMGDLEIVCLLVRNGADVNAREGLCGRTALHLAIERNNDPVVHYLVQFPETLNTKIYSGEAAHEIAINCWPEYVETNKVSETPPGSLTLEDDEMSARNILTDIIHYKKASFYSNKMEKSFDLLC